MYIGLFESWTWSLFNTHRRQCDETRSTVTTCVMLSLLMEVANLPSFRLLQHTTGFVDVNIVEPGPAYVDRTKRQISFAAVDDRYRRGRGLFRRETGPLVPSEIHVCRRYVTFE